MFLDMGRRVRLAVQTLKGEQVNAREKLKVDSKRTRRAFPEWWSEEDFAWWSKGKKGFSKAFQKAMNAFRKVGFRTHQPEEGAGKDFLQHEGRGGKGGAYPQSGLSAPETPSEEGFCRAWESDDWSSSLWPDESSTLATGWSCTRAYTAWMAAVPLNLTDHPAHVFLDLGCTRSIGSRAAIERFQKQAWYYGITTEFCRCHKSFVFANSETGTCWESCIIHFPTTPPCIA